MTTFRDEVSGVGTTKPELVMDNTFAESGSLSERVDISPTHIVRRTSACWDGIAADTIEFTRREVVDSVTAARRLSKIRWDRLSAFGISPFRQ